MKARLIAGTILLALCGAGCLPAGLKFGSAPAESATADRTWKNVSNGIGRYECGPAACGVRLILYRFAKNEFAWHFANSSQPATVEGWAAALPKAVFVANGVYFDENWQPTGLLKTSGAAVNDRSYDPDLSGLLVLAPAVTIVDTSGKQLNLNQTAEAAQSFPLLIKAGVPVAAFKDEHAARRTWIGTDKNGDVYVGTVPEDGITFASLAKLLAGTGVKWNNVLNLDGGTSTGFAVRAGNFLETMNSIVQVPNVIVAERK